MLHDEVEPLVVQTSQLATANCAAQALVTSFHLYSSRRCLGWRTGESYTWHSYEEIGSMSAHFADSLQQLLRKVSATKGTPVIGLLSAVSIPWFIVDFACSLAAIPLVTMHRATDDAALAQILDKTGLCLLIASMHLQPVIQRASSRASASKLQMVIWIEDSSEPYCLQQSSRPLATGTDSSPPSWQQKGFLDALQEGSQALRVPSWRDPKRLAKLLPSSGSTGAPKLAVVTEEALFKGSCGRTPESLPGRLGSVDIVTYAYEAIRQSHDVLMQGGRIGTGVFSGSLDRMLEDVRALFWTGLYSDFENDVVEERSLLGNRIDVLISTGAPLQHQVQRFITSRMAADRVFGKLVVDGYGCTETGRIASNGTVAENVEIRLLDLPELGYLTSDSPPRGEILARTPYMAGYFSLERFTDQGTVRQMESDSEDWIVLNSVMYFRTGDVGELAVAPGNVRVIDRCKHHFKLAQGIHVAPEPIERVLLQSPLISQIFIWGCGFMQATGAVAEIPQRIVLEPVAFSEDAGLLTASGNFDPRDSILSLGLDSMGVALETLADLERLILAGPRATRAIVGKCSTVVNFEEEAEARCEDLASCVESRASAQRTPQSGHVVLLTGSTGFLGSFVAHALAHAGFKVHCLVRATCQEEATERLRTCLSFYQLSEDVPESISALPTTGVENPGLGVSEHAMPGMIDSIVHCAATVSGVLPYNALCTSNVTGTKQAILLALQKGARLVYVSTLGFVDDGHPETRRVSTANLHQRSGYAQSKWMAEQLVWRATESFGLRAVVLRPGTVCGARSGASNTKDAVSLLLLGLVKLGSTCTADRSPLPAGFNLVPVDYVADAVAFWLELCHELKDLSPEEFCKRVQQVDEMHPLYALRTISSLMTGRYKYRHLELQKTRKTPMADGDVQSDTIDWGKILGEELMLSGRAQAAQAAADKAANTEGSVQSDGDQPSAKEEKQSTVRTLHAIPSALKLLVLYFSGRWCPACTEFDSVIKDVYAGLKSLEESSDIEVVWVSCDLSEDTYKMHMKRIGSLLGAVWSPKRLQELSDRWKVKAIPAALVLDARDGRIVTATARRDMEEAKQRVMRSGSKDTRETEIYGSLMFRWLERLDAQRAALDDGMPVKGESSDESSEGSGSGQSSRSHTSKASSRRNSESSAQAMAEALALYHEMQDGGLKLLPIAVCRDKLLPGLQWNWALTLLKEAAGSQLALDVTAYSAAISACAAAVQWKWAEAPALRLSSEMAAAGADGEKNWQTCAIHVLSGVLPGVLWEQALNFLLGARQGTVLNDQSVGAIDLDSIAFATAVRVLATQSELASTGQDKRNWYGKRGKIAAFRAGEVPELLKALAESGSMKGNLICAAEWRGAWGGGFVWSAAIGRAMPQLPVPAAAVRNGHGPSADCGRVLLAAALGAHSKLSPANQSKLVPVSPTSPYSPWQNSSEGTPGRRVADECLEDGESDQVKPNDAEEHKAGFGWYLIRSALNGLRSPSKQDADQEQEQPRVQKDHSLDLIETMEEGHAHEITSDFVVPLRRSSKLWRFRVVRSEDKLSARLITDAGDFLMHASVRLEASRVDFHLYDPSQKDLFNPAKPAFTMGFNSSRDEWRLVAERCQACQYVPPHLSCATHGKQQVAVIKHRQASVGEGISNIMEVRIPGLYQNDTSVIWCPMLGMPDLAEAELSNEMQQLITRKPVWNEKVQSLVLDFKGRNIVSSEILGRKVAALRKLRDKQLAKQARSTAVTDTSEEQTCSMPVQVLQHPPVGTRYRLAAEKGHTVAQWRLGELLELLAKQSGLNGQKPNDAREALHWYTLAAQSGNAEAQSALALLLEDGADGVDQDPAAALTWHLAAAEKGNAVSQYCAACRLSSGGDVEAAHHWLQLSADQGFRPAKQVLEEAELSTLSGNSPGRGHSHLADPTSTADGEDLVGLAMRIAQQLKGLQDDEEAAQLLEELLNDCPSLVDSAGDAIADAASS
ncbi:Long chain acyl-CoA synthetase 7, peroxisomal [Symbiodinium microadriaticum]|uniref:Long chain acyl-CoA synthetase 7, peroxisomal n=1 Tax=Symbiodinium microadriaticum TaxID=2951 RepID=A0A1Q9DIM2_SYMMI|nr:Long chain acyl-CoA synthetase 7, peroxisomal [Symbiodinium microadriaticum]